MDLQLQRKTHEISLKANGKLQHRRVRLFPAGYSLSYFGAIFFPPWALLKENAVGKVISVILLTSYHHL